MNIIGIAGQLQNGKTTVGNMLLKGLGPDWKKVSFASPIKKMVCDTFGVTPDFIEKWKVLPEPAPGFILPMREVLIQIGDGFRKMRPTIWIDKALENYNSSSLTDDVRYINELKSIKERGGTTILVWRKGRENDMKNDSEAQIKPIVDFFVRSEEEGRVADMSIRRANTPVGCEFVDIFLRNEGTLEDLEKKVESFLPLFR